VELAPDAAGRRVIERLTVPGGAGHPLAAIRHEPPGTRRGTVLLAPPFASSKDLRGLRRIAERLAERGWASLRFDFTGLSGSGGTFAETTLGTNADDLAAVAAWLRAQGTPARMVLGQSLGGAAALLAAPRLPELAVLATLAAPSTTDHLGAILRTWAPELSATGRAEIDVMGNRVTVGKELLEDLARRDLLAAAAALRVPYVIFHSARDTVVDIEHARKLFRVAPPPRSFVSLDRADHLLLEDPRDAALVADTLAAFGERYASSAE